MSYRKRDPTNLIAAESRKFLSTTYNSHGPECEVQH
uniref:Uncharacterized protein MANES_01G058300 n=1 Tax=Rhizophora mucronata TaxID=61149 RepID=A0A2P2JG40_RHIMU